VKKWREGSLERELRNRRPSPSDGYVRRLEAEISATAPRTSRLRVAAAGALTVSMLAAVAAVGGIGYAANAAKSAASVVKQAVAPDKNAGPVAIRGLNAGKDQYRPGYGWGDENHTHTGPPGLRRAGGPFAPPLRPRYTNDGRAAIVSTSFTLTEQALLSISVLGPGNRKLLLTQEGSNVGEGVTGPQTKVILYQVLIPRSIPMQLRIPANLLRRGTLYRIIVRAKDPDGNVQAITIPFRA
jgi:hypothetical protein